MLQDQKLRLIESYALIMIPLITSITPNHCVLGLVRFLADTIERGVLLPFFLELFVLVLQHLGMEFAPGRVFGSELVAQFTLIIPFLYPHPTDIAPVYSGRALELEGQGRAFLLSGLFPKSDLFRCSSLLRVGSAQALDLLSKLFHLLTHGVDLEL